MLHTCNFGQGKRAKGGKGMSLAEYSAQLATWSVLASPLVLSADIRTLQTAAPDCLRVLLNQDLLAVSQDPAANSPTVVFTTQANATVRAAGQGGSSKPVTTAQGLSRKMADGSVALVLLNRDDHESQVLGATWAELGLPKTAAACTVRDVLAQANLPPATRNFSARVASHSASFVRIKCKAEAP